MKSAFGKLALVVVTCVAALVARAQDSVAGVERFTPADGGKVTYDRGVLSAYGKFITYEINIANSLSIDASTFDTIKGRPLMKQSVWSGQTSAIAAKFSASKETYNIGGTPYVVVSAGPGTSGAAPSTAKLINVATRAAIQAGGNLNPGFVITGGEQKKVLIRAVGPGLAALGVSNTLADPLVTIYSGSTVVGSNDNWSADPAQGAAIEAAAAAVGAFKITAGSRDAALLLTLAPGSYTAVARGADGGGGELIVEIYEVP